MRIPVAIAFLCCFALGFNSCSQSPRHEEPNAREAGREAYRASKDLKKDAKEAARELRDAGEKFREGWKEAQREDQNTRATPAPRRDRPTASEADRNR